MSEPDPHDVSAVSADERPVGWGDDVEAVDEDRDADDRLREDRPPHYDRD